MRALEYRDGPALSLVEREAPTIETPDDVIVRIVHSGICGTDRSILVGKFHAQPGTILGHESVGIVEETGASVSQFNVGDMVIVNPTLYCGRCSECMVGRLNYCKEKAGNEIGIDRDGTFAERFRIASQFLYRVPAAMSLDKAVLVEPLVCALSNVRAGDLQAGEKILILGGGPMGVLTAMLSHHFGAEVVLAEADLTRRALCSDMLHTSFHDRMRIVATDNIPADMKFDLVIDCVGGLLESAIPHCANGGRIVIMGYDSRAVATIKPLDILLRGIRIIGAGDYNSQLFTLGITIAQSLPIERIITDRFSLEDYEEAFSRLSPQKGQEYRSMKVLLISSAGAIR